MSPTSLRRPLAAALLLTLLALLATGCDAGDPDVETSVTVMTRNLYLGGDLFALLDPSCAPTDVNPIATAVCVNDLYVNGVVTSDIHARMGAVAAEIEAADPDLVGLQEVSWYRRQLESDYVLGDTTANATETTYDFLQILQDSLDARGLDYVVAAENENADVEFPATATGGQSFYDLRLTDRDVILARAGLDTGVLITTNFAFNAEIPIGSTTVTFTRGYSAVTVAKDGVDFTFANAHLEVGGDAALVQRAQGQVLASSLGDDEPLILVGDFNANPDAEADPAQADAYEILVDAFDDAWAALQPSEPGFTCCQSADLRNDTPTLDERIDLILYQGNVAPSIITVVGEEESDRTGAGLWPSDHAGVVATLVVSN